MPVGSSASRPRPTGSAALPEGVQLTELGSGLRVITEAMPSVRSVALGLWVRTGSRDESSGQEGLSHFLEHLLFKGTPEYSAIEISEELDGMGAAANAATSKESTHLHARFLDEHTADAFGLLAAMLTKPTMPSDEVDSERQVILEEIAMYEDEPQDRVHDVLAEAIHGTDTPLGKRVLGLSDVIASVSVPAIRSYHDGRYTPANVVVSAAGHIEHDAIVELAREIDLPASNGSGAAANGHVHGERAFRFYPKETEQYHVCFGGPGIARGDDRRFALTVLDTAFGGSTSSRLFKEIREKRGLAYAVGSYTEQFIDDGAVAMYVGTRADNVAEACEIIGRELSGLHSDGLTEEEIHRAKEHVKGRMVLGLESSGARMSRCARSVLFDLELLSLDELLARVEAVTADDVTALARQLYDPEQLSAACIGPDEDCFRSAVGSVSAGLAA